MWRPPPSDEEKNEARRRLHEGLRRQALSFGKFASAAKRATRAVGRLDSAFSGFNTAMFKRWMAEGSPGGVDGFERWYHELMEE